MDLNGLSLFECLYQTAKNRWGLDGNCTGKIMEIFLVKISVFGNFYYRHSVLGLGEVQGF